MQSKALTEGFLLRESEYFCKNGTNVEVGSVASSGCRGNKYSYIQHIKYVLQ